MSGLRAALEKLCDEWSERTTGYDQYRELRGLLAAHPVDPAPDPQDETTGAEGHDLVVSLGDCAMHGACTCGRPLGTIKPNQSLDVLGQAWERHVMTEVPR